MKVKTLQKLLEACDPESKVRIEPCDIDEIGKMWCLFEVGEIADIPTFEIYEAKVNVSLDNVPLIELEIDMRDEPRMPLCDVLEEVFDDFYEIKKK